MNFKKGPIKRSTVQSFVHQFSVMPGMPTPWPTLLYKSQSVYTFITHCMTLALYVSEEDFLT